MSLRCLTFILLALHLSNSLFFSFSSPFEGYLYPKYQSKPGVVGSFSEDGVFVSETTIALGDGLGGTRYNSGLFANYLVMKFVESFSKAANSKPTEADFSMQVKRAAVKAAQGFNPKRNLNVASTMVTLRLYDSTLMANIIGDSGFEVLRLNPETMILERVFRSAEKVVRFNAPTHINQMGQTIGESKKIEVKEGDIVFAASDGLFDNISSPFLLVAASFLAGKMVNGHLNGSPVGDYDLDIADLLESYIRRLNALSLGFTEKFLLIEDDSSENTDENTKNDSEKEEETEARKDAENIRDSSLSASGKRTFRFSRRSSSEIPTGTIFRAAGRNPNIKPGPRASDSSSQSQSKPEGNDPVTTDEVDTNGGSLVRKANESSVGLGANRVGRILSWFTDGVKSTLSFLARGFYKQGPNATQHAINIYAKHEETKKTIRRNFRLASTTPSYTIMLYQELLNQRKQQFRTPQSWAYMPLFGYIMGLAPLESQGFAQPLIGPMNPGIQAKEVKISEGNLEETSRMSAEFFEAVLPRAAGEGEKVITEARHTMHKDVEDLRQEIKKEEENEKAEGKTDEIDKKEVLPSDERMPEILPEAVRRSLIASIVSKEVCNLNDPFEDRRLSSHLPGSFEGVNCFYPEIKAEKKIEFYPDELGHAWACNRIEDLVFPLEPDQTFSECTLREIHPLPANTSPKLLAEAFNSRYFSRNFALAARIFIEDPRVKTSNFLLKALYDPQTRSLRVPTQPLKIPKTLFTGKLDDISIAAAAIVDNPKMKIENFFKKDAKVGLGFSVEEACRRIENENVEFLKTNLKGLNI